METCLRQIHLRMTPAGGLTEWPSNPHRKEWLAVPELRSGNDAYRFLLEVTTGLCSAIPGETNVFGQFKKAWLNFRCTGEAAEVAHLAPTIHRLIDDTKTIRQEHLEGIGGCSYGSLARKLIAPRPGDKILFVGAGDLARSMLPLFRSHSLGIWHYRDIEVPNSLIERVFLPDQGQGAASWADHVILTTPADNHNDANWQDWLSATRARTVVHLGQHRAQDRVLKRNWGNALAYYDLADMLALRREQDDHRSEQLMRARAACRQRAKAFALADRLAARNNATIERLAVKRSMPDASLALA